MKLHFEPDLDYQHAAIEAVTDLFRGQESCRTEFTVTRQPTGAQGVLAFAETDLGVGNRLHLLGDEILNNLREVQLRNGLRPSESLEGGDFTVEMETGTGKTYVYLRTILELNRRYGFTKFVIVVPSVAIKEGVLKTLEITREHFQSLYANVPYVSFAYDSSRLGQVRDFATSPHIRIMVVTVGAINKKDVNNLYKQSEKVNDEKPIDLIRATRPIIIVDEPQSVDGGLEGRGREALAAMSPLCTLRYSATHADKHHMVYRLDAVDAYERRLVKQIEVASLEVEGAHNRPYVRLVGVKTQRGAPTASVELDIKGLLGVSREARIVRDGDDLEQTTGRPVYRNCRIGEIRAGRGKEVIEVKTPGDEVWLRPGQAVGDVDRDAFSRQMIARTIREHLQKELRLAPQGIKVLSLFFIESVAFYRSYDEDGNPIKGKYALMFEEEYRRLAKHPDFQGLFKGIDLKTDASAVHDGYFSIDRKQRFTETSEGNQAGRDDAERGYSLIMRDKERLLSFETRLKFIFSHSALREGWDSPNVFQICALREVGTERERRQTIGRGLRLCVNQEGARLRGFDVNTLTVIAHEGYEEFAANLQKEIEEDTGIRFGIVEKHQFAAIPVTDVSGKTVPLGMEKSEALWTHLKAAGLVDAKGRVQDALRTALKDNKLTLPAEFAGVKEQVAEALRKLAGGLAIRNADERVPVRTRQANLDSPEFKALWDRIKHKTTYRVEFDNEKLLRECTTALSGAPAIRRTRIIVRKADVSIGRGGVTAEHVTSDAPRDLPETDIELPDLLTELQDRTQLTRRSIVRILIESGRLDDFKHNPQEFIAVAAESINRSKRLAIVDGIKYQRIGDHEYWAQELFKQNDLVAYLRNTIEALKSVYERVVYDSPGIEKTFAEDLEANEAVKVYAKLPPWFQVPTPLGTYNPDWAVLVDKDGEERLYLVVETKGSLWAGDLRLVESAKIDCGKAHFKALAVGESPAEYLVETKLEDVLAKAGRRPRGSAAR